MVARARPLVHHAHAMTAFVVFAAGYGVAKGIEAFRARRRRAEIRRGQDEWRQNRPAAGATAIFDKATGLPSK